MASHPKIAHARPRAELLKSQSDLIDARAELQASENSLKRTQSIEAEALMAWITVNPSPSAEDVTRAHINRAQAERAARVAEGQTPEAKAVPKVGNATIDQALANRPRNNRTNRASAPMRPPMFKA